jgi:hypothetical protein
MFPRPLVLTVMSVFYEKYVINIYYMSCNNVIYEVNLILEKSQVVSLNHDPLSVEHRKK